MDKIYKGNGVELPINEKHLKIKEALQETLAKHLADLAEFTADFLFLIEQDKLNHHTDNPDAKKIIKEITDRYALESDNAISEYKKLHSKLESLVDRLLDEFENVK